MNRTRAAYTTAYRIRRQMFLARNHTNIYAALYRQYKAAAPQRILRAVERSFYASR